MRRDYFTLQVRAVDWPDEQADPEVPRLCLHYDGPTKPLRNALQLDDESLIPAEELDVAFRLQGSIEDPDSTGVLSLTNRLRGDFIVEVNTSVDPMVRFLTAARRYGEHTSDSTGRFTIEIHLDDDHRLTYDKRTLLVYNESGTLLRQHSLIPSGVEL